MNKKRSVREITFKLDRGGDVIEMQAKMVVTE